MSAPASTMAWEFRLFQFGFETEIENDSALLSASGRTASGMSLIKPITIVTGPASSVLLTTLGLLANTLAKSDRRSSVAFCTGAGLFGAVKITADGSTRIPRGLELARAAELFVFCAEAKSEITQIGTSTVVRMTRQDNAC